MKLYVMDAFANRIFGGNQAGVALPDRELSDETMRQIAAEMKHSETAFIHMEPDGSVSLRYFTPAGEVDLCGHATVASFALLRQLEKIGDGDHTAHTKAGELNITVRGGTVWMDMAPPQLIGDIPAAERAALYAAYGLTEADCPDKICVEQGRVRYTGQCITCLPNKLTVTLEGGDAPEVDLVS